VTAGYEVFLYYYWLDSPEAAIARVALRVRNGGHFVPDADIRRRYARSVRNFLELYRPIADWWEVFDNTHGQRALLAIGSGDEQDEDNPDTWAAFVRSAEHE
jgi:predicted ABC-type ATPase